MSYVVDLPVFQGPLDLLLHLVRRHEMDIYDIPIAALADQYMETLAQLDQLDLDVAGEFLVMATTLLEIKSRMLLPVPPKEEDAEAEDPRMELARRLIEYEAFKNAAETLREMEAFSTQRYMRGGTESAGDYPYDGPKYRNATGNKLFAALQRMLDEAALETGEPPLLPRDQWTVSLKMREISILLHHNPDGVFFHETVPPRACRLEIIVTFLAVLEMLKRGRIQLVQDAPWSEIRIVGVGAK